jgi:hypothetical protein
MQVDFGTAELPWLQCICVTCKCKEQTFRINEESVIVVLWWVPHTGGGVSLIALSVSAGTSTCWAIESLKCLPDSFSKGVPLGEVS